MKSYIPENDNTKLYTIALLSLFDELVLVNYNGNEYTIPLYFGSSNRKVSKRNTNHNKSYPKYSLTLPAMSLTIDNIDYNTERQTNKYLRKKRVDVKNDNNQTMLGWNDTSVDINFNLEIKAKNIEELLRITEYITTVFINGKYYVDVKHIMYDNPISTPIILNSNDVEIEMNSDIADDNRNVSTLLSFTVKGIYVSNVKSLTKQILDARLRIWEGEQFDELLQEYSVEVVV